MTRAFTATAVAAPTKTALPFLQTYHTITPTREIPTKTKTSDVIIYVFSRNCGCLVFGDKDDEFVKETESALIRHNVPHDTFMASEQRRRYPNMRTPDNFGFVLDKSGGVLKADKILQAYQVHVFLNN